MSNMPNWLVPEDDRTIPTGALWRQWYWITYTYLMLINCRFIADWSVEIMNAAVTPYGCRWMLVCHHNRMSLDVSVSSQQIQQTCICVSLDCRGRRGDRWIYNYLCNPCLPPLSALTLWVRIPFMVRCTRYNIMW